MKYKIFESLMFFLVATLFGTLMIFVALYSFNREAGPIIWLLEYKYEYNARKYIKCLEDNETLILLNEKACDFCKKPVCPSEKVCLNLPYKNTRENLFNEVTAENEKILEATKESESEFQRRLDEKRLELQAFEKKIFLDEQRALLEAREAQ